MAGQDTAPIASVTVAMPEPNTETGTSSNRKLGSVWKPSGQPHQQVVGPAAVITGECPDQDADADGDQRGHEADQQRYARAMEDLGGNVAAGLVGAEPEARVLQRPLQRAPGQRKRVGREQERGGGRHGG
ncbi:hypothetical protein ACU4HD_42680 [Cupriavidus basilensis]